MEVTKVTVMGSLATCTYFKDEKGITYRVEVRFGQTITVSNQITFYEAHFYKKNFKGRMYKYLGSTTGCNVPDDQRKNIFDWKSIFTEQDLYTAYHNHWDNLNPLKAFCFTHHNSHYLDFLVIPKEPTNSYKMVAKNVDKFDLDLRR